MSLSHFTIHTYCFYKYKAFANTTNLCIYKFAPIFHMKYDCIDTYFFQNQNKFLTDKTNSPGLNLHDKLIKTSSNEFHFNLIKGDVWPSYTHVD